MLEVSQSAEINRREEGAVAFFIPGLAAILCASEGEKGPPLTKAEVLAVRDSSKVVLIPQLIAIQMSESRGYDDIDPANCWTEWQLLRLSLIDAANT